MRDANEIHGDSLTLHGHVGKEMRDILGKEMRTCIQKEI